TRSAQMPEPRVRLFRRPEAGVLPHRPELAAVHQGMDAAGVRKRARTPKLARGIRSPRPVVGTVDGLAVAHFAPTAASTERIRAAKATSSLLPITSGVRMSRCDRRNSPIVGSSVNPCTPFPVVYTSIVLGPYRM